jgi:hypothetical protein
MDQFAKLVEDALKVLNRSGSLMGTAGDTPSPVSRGKAAQPKAQEEPAHVSCSQPAKKES